MAKPKTKTVKKPQGPTDMEIWDAIVDSLCAYDAAESVLLCDQDTLSEGKSHDDGDLGEMAQAVCAKVRGVFTK